ncbi:hypothetical protein [Plantactinospora sp. B5E13]|uniref:hypothetical protein n=1 Tax=unclassified Plantactinospora TaxID=2631981 RepID=UPI00325E03D8
MQRARRLASIAVIAVLGTTALSACRSDSSVAAYVGDRKITENEVTSVLDDAKSKVPPDATVTPPDRPTVPGQARVPSRPEVVGTLLMAEVCRQLAAEKGFQPVPQSSMDASVQQLALPATARYVQLYTEVKACEAGIPVQPVTPTPEQLADLVARGRAADVIPLEAKDEEAAQQLNQEIVHRALATRAALVEALAARDITVNPRYQPLEYSVLPFANNMPAVAMTVGPTGPDTMVDPR